MIRVEMGNKKDIERGIKEWKNKVRKTKLMEELRTRQEFKSKAIIKREQKNKAHYIQVKYRTDND